MDDGNIALKTLASKNQTSTQKSQSVLTQQQRRRRPRKMPAIENPTREKKPLIAIFADATQATQKSVIKDRVIRPYVQLRSEIVERLLNDTCEVCGGRRTYRCIMFDTYET